MIFKTINADATKLTEQFGLLDKSFRDIKKDFANGLGLKNSLFQTSISDSDYKALQKFNTAIKATNDGMTKSQRITQAWNDNMTGCSIAAKRMGNDLVTGKKKISDISSEMKNATASTEALGVAMNIFANIGIMLAIAAITKVITELAQAQEKAIQAAKEATETYKEETDSIDDYKEKLSELLEELNSDNISYEEAKTKRKELMSIQDELIEKFGTEEDAIKSITDAINGQVDALDYLTEKAYRDWVAKADEVTFWNGLLPWGKSGLDKAIEFMETPKTVSFYDMQNANLSDELQEIQKEIDETIQAKYNLDKSFATFKVTGTPEEIKSQLELIRQDYLDLSKDAFLKNGISSEMWEEYRKEAIESINEVINKFDEGLENHQKTYQTYIEGMIKYDSEYSDEYANILQKRAELESVEFSGNEEEIKKARQEFMDAINKGIEESGSNENIKKYFESLYPELQAQFADWNFEFAIDANTDNLDETIKEIGDKYTATDLLNLIDDDSAVIADAAFNSLIDKAIEYGICTDKSAEEVQKLIDLLVELGYVQDNVKGETFNNETPDFFTQLTNSQDSIDKFQSSVKSAADAYATLLSGNYSSSELLDSIQTINQAVTDMGGKLDWDIINRNSDSLDLLGDAIEYISQQYAESVLSGAGIDVDSEFSQMLSNIIQQAYEVEVRFTGMNAQLDSLQSSYQTLTGILESYNEKGYISLDNLQSLLTADENLIAMLEVENGQLVLNQEAYENLVAVQLLEFKAKLDDAAAAEIEALAKNKAEEATNNNAQAAEDAVAKLDAETDALKRNAEAASEDAIAKAINNAQEAGVSEKEIQSVLDKYTEIWESALNNYHVDFDSFMRGGNDAAKKAGKDAGREYVNSFNDAISGVGKIIDKQISAYQKQKDAAVKALEAERDAALEAVQAEIDGKQEVIDGIQDEIDAMREANEERKRQATLQQKLYELEKMQNMRSKLVNICQTL